MMRVLEYNLANDGADVDNVTGFDESLLASSNIEDPVTQMTEPQFSFENLNTDFNNIESFRENGGAVPMADDEFDTWLNSLLNFEPDSAMDQTTNRVVLDMSNQPQSVSTTNALLCDPVMSLESNLTETVPEPSGFSSINAPPVNPTEDLMFVSSPTLNTGRGGQFTAGWPYLEASNPEAQDRPFQHQGALGPLIAVENKIVVQPTTVPREVSTNSDSPYLQVPNPFTMWTSMGGAVFEYSMFGELKSPNRFQTWHWRAVKDFIYEHPVDSNRRLTIWIQRTPTNCSWRYQTSRSGKCIFAQCPAWQHGLQGTITRGHIRVAFDEKYAAYGDQTDPYHCAAYAHLYCVERFLNLPEILTLPNIDVRVDTREIDWEPNGRFAGALTKDAALVARRFISAAQRKCFTNMFPSYPDHSKGAPTNFTDVHSNTLNHAMQMATQTTRKAAVRQRSGPNNVATHMGDIEVYCKAHKTTRQRQGKQLSRAFQERKNSAVARGLEEQGK